MDNMDYGRQGNRGRRHVWLTQALDSSVGLSNDEEDDAPSNEVVSDEDDGDDALTVGDETLWEKSIAFELEGGIEMETEELRR